ncbi:MAG: hypothetical protein WAM66_07170, partial [Acidobacteriaceae bacterium]
AVDGRGGAAADGGGGFGVVAVEGGEPFAETGGVKLRDAEDADAALGASEAAVKPGAGATGGVGGGGVHDLD